jgi:hypothetical protein
MFRGVHLFNQEINTGHTIETYEDFQNHVNDDQLIEGAYKIGVIGWEAWRILKHAKETRHIFSGHPKSSDPSPVKVLSMIDDCVKYVLNEEYPVRIIDINEYLENLRTEEFDRNEVAVENAIGDLPEKYKVELANRLFTVYIHPDSPTTLLSNIEFVAPILWRSLPKTTKIQITRRIDQEYPRGNSVVTKQAFKFTSVVDGTRYISASARKYLLTPIVKKLKESLDVWSEESKCVRKLAPFSDVIPPEIQKNYVWAITHTYIGFVGGSYHFRRTDFYSNGAAPHIPKMFEKFDDNMIEFFVDTIKESDTLKRRLESPSKIRRLRNLGNICLERCSETFAEIEFLEMLCDEDREDDFFREINR